MNFIGNKKATDLLEKGISNAVLNHAYLFSGPENVGKFTLAKMFALKLIAGKKDFDLSLDSFDRDAELDLIVLEPEVIEKKGILKRRDISIESIRESKQKLSLFPYHGKYKILIVNDAHRMTISAQNALLKTLEEPNPTTMIILVTHEIDRILPTILSRLQVINFGLVSDAEMDEIFGRNDLFKKDCIGLSIGRPGLAQYLNFHEEERLLRMNALKEFEKIKSISLNDRFKLAEIFSKDTAKAIDKLNLWIWELRKEVMFSEKNAGIKAYENIEKIQNSMAVIKRTNSNARLILETLFMDLQ